MLKLHAILYYRKCLFLCLNLQFSSSFEGTLIFKFQDPARFHRTACNLLLFFAQSM